MDQVRRRRECQECTRRFTTYEKLAESEIIVAKRGGGQESFDRDKLLRVVERVARGRKLAESSLRDLVRGLEAELLDVGARTVASATIAQRLLTRLGALDGVAAERFASNYRQEDGSVRMTDDEPSPQLDLLAAVPVAAAAPAAPAARTADPPEVPARRRGRPPRAVSRAKSGG
jgi:transcriptional repressor NrdR